MSSNVATPITVDVRKPQGFEQDVASWSNARLVEECLQGNERGWSALIERYKRLIFSIPVKFGLSREDASDIFQAVCVEILSELPKLRAAEALPKWIIQITSHKCSHHKRQLQRLQSFDPDDQVLDPETSARADRILCEAVEEQQLRQAISAIPDRCQRLVHMLFFEEPSRPYEEVARSLGIALGSVGFIRQRCLDRLRKKLVELGF